MDGLVQGLYQGQASKRWLPSHGNSSLESIYGGRERRGRREGEGGKKGGKEREGRKWKGGEGGKGRRGREGMYNCSFQTPGI